MLVLKPEFWTQETLASSCQVCPLAPIAQVKRHGKGQRKKIRYMAQDTLWEEAE
jgi:hypothetical protein